MNKLQLPILIAKKKENKKSFAVLIDPDKTTHLTLLKTIELCEKVKVDYIFIGGSLIASNQLEKYVKDIKKNSSMPVFLFPGNAAHITSFADSLLYLSLISGRNADLLIGQHVQSAIQVKQSGLEIIPTGYMIIDGGKPTSVSYISNTMPIPSDKNDIAISTAIAAEMLGMKLIYLDAGSGAKHCIKNEMIASVAKNISLPLIVGGGINNAKKAFQCIQSGADVIVVGNAIEKKPSLIKEISEAIR